MSRKRRQKESAYINNNTFLQYYKMLKQISVNSFKWLYMPSTVDKRYLEETLYRYGKALFFYDDVVGFVALPFVDGGEGLTLYDEPIKRIVNMSNGYHAERDFTNSVIIYQNSDHDNIDYIIRNFAYRLYEIQRSTDVNVKVQKFPLVLLCDEQQTLSLKNLYMQIDGNEPVIFGSKNLGSVLEDMKVLKTDAPFVADKLEILFHNVLNDALSFLGIENANSDKKERLVSDEVGSNYGFVEAQRNSFLNPRHFSVEKINDMFDLDIEVKFNSSLLSNVNRINVEEVKLNE